MSGTRRSLRSGRTATIVAVVAVVAGVVLVAVALVAQRSAPEPHRAGRIDPPVSSPKEATTPGAAGQGTGGATSASKTPLGRSKPTYLAIPAIGVKTPVRQLGLAPDGSLAVPQPGPDLNHAAWFENSPTPGQPGPSIIEGHVDSTSGPSIFFKLGATKVGDRIDVNRADGSRLEFRVNAVREFQKSAFPTELVYGGKNLSEPTLRLITCSNFDPKTRHHTGNEVVFAHLTKVSGKS